MASAIWWSANLGLVHYMGDHVVGNCIKPNCAAIEIPANISAAIAIAVVIQ